MEKSLAQFKQCVRIAVLRLGKLGWPQSRHKNGLFGMKKQGPLDTSNQIIFLFIFPAKLYLAVSVPPSGHRHWEALEQI